MKRKILLLILTVLYFLLIEGYSWIGGQPAAGASGGTARPSLMPVGQVGGAVTAVALQDDLAFLAVGPRLVIYDVSQPASPYFLGQTEALSGLINDMAVQGDYVYLLGGWDLGFLVVDVSDPGRPELITRFQLGGENMVVRGGYAYIAAGANGLLAVSVANPHQPQIVSFFETDGVYGDISLGEDLLFVQEWQGQYKTHLYALQAQASITKIGELHGSYFPAAVIGRVGYRTVETGLEVLDFTDPLAPQLVTTLDFGGAIPAHAMVMVGQTGLVGLSGSASFAVLDLSQPSAPVEVGRYVSPTVEETYRPVLMAADGDLALTATPQFGPALLELVSIATPAQPQPQSLTPLATAVSFKHTAVSDGYLFAVGSDLHVFALSEPHQPQAVAYLPTQPAYHYAMDVADGRLYLGGHNANFLMPTFSIIDITNPLSPQLRSETSVPSIISALTVADDIAYLLASPWFTDTQSLLLWDVSAPAAPAALGQYQSPSMPDGGTMNAFTVSGQTGYLALTAYLPDTYEVIQILEVIDVSDPANPTWVANLELNSDVYHMVVDGSTLYLDVNWEGLIALDISQPQQPVELGRVLFPADGSGFPRSTIQNGLAFQASTTNGLRLVDVQDPTAMTAVDLKPTPGRAIGVAANGNFIYVADEDGGLRVYQLGQKAAFLGLMPHHAFPTRGDKVLHLELNEPAGATTFQDATAYGHDGVCQGEGCPEAGVPGVKGTAVRFDGHNDAILLGNPPDLYLETEMTLAAWIKPEAADGIRNIIARGYTVDPPREIFLRVNDGRYEAGSWWGFAPAIASTPIPDEDMGQWVYLAAVYKDDTWTLYRNGEAVGTVFDLVPYVPTGWAVGANSDGTARFFAGSMDEVQIFKRGLTAVEIQVLAQEP